MRIGVASIGDVSSDTGGRNYIEHFFRTLSQLPTEHTFVLFLSEGERAKLSLPQTAAIEYIEVPNSSGSSMKKVIGEQFRLPRYISRAKVDLMYFPGNFVSLLSSTPSVLNIRATAHFYGERYGITGSRRWIRRLLMPLSARKAKKIITPSKDIKRDVVRFTGVDADKITVIPHGVDTSLFDGDANRANPEGLEVLEQFGLRSGEYLLYVSALWPYKNQDKLINAFAPIAAVKPELKLVIAGKGTGLSEEYLKRLYVLPEQLHLTDRVVFTGQQPQRMLRFLYTHASAFVFPSSYESFGNPIFESWSSGIPVATSNVHSFPEVVGDAGILFDPLDHEEFTQVLKQITSDSSLREQLIQTGSERVKKFTWESCCKRTLQVLESVRPLV